MMRFIKRDPNIKYPILHKMKRLVPNSALFNNRYFKGISMITIGLSGFLYVFYRNELELMIKRNKKIEDNN